MSVQRLDWDSDFFELEVGKWEGCDEESIDETNLDSFQLVYQISDALCDISIPHFTESYSEVKTLFIKRDLAKNDRSIEAVYNAQDLDLEIDTLYDLAYESGKFSRFKQDPNMANEQFEALYRLWIDNSLHNNFSDGFLVKLVEDIPAGLVTYRFSQDHATIGLIAVSPQYQGRGIGQELLTAAENHVIESGMESMVIPTQKNNEIACRFYKKNGYSLMETKYIKHLWRDSL